MSADSLRASLTKHSEAESAAHERRHRGSTMVHPSRSAPRCIDCAYLDARPGEHARYCNHPGFPVNPVDGRPTTDVYAMRLDLLLPKGHSAVRCGQAGALFVLRDHAAGVTEQPA